LQILALTSPVKKLWKRFASDLGVVLENSLHDIS